MGTTHQTSCALCSINCGLEVLVEDNRIVKTRPDKANPRSQGYACRKGLNIAFHQHNADRLRHPLKRTGSKFEKISWEKAVGEIAERLRAILQAHGPRSLAWVLSGQGCHFGLGFAGRFGNLLGSRYNYTALGQEHTGRFWAHGLTLGSQTLTFVPDYAHTDLVMAVGWNPLMSHQTPQAPLKFRKMAKDPDKLIVVVDPRRSETARIADIHLALRPGTDALLFRAMIAIILEEGWHNQDYIGAYVNGVDQIRPWFKAFDIRNALQVCGLEYGRVREVCRLFASRHSCLHDDLGSLMNRHSTLVSYLLVVLLTICGRIGVPGGNCFPSRLFELGTHSDPDDPATWRTTATGIPAIQGMFPPNVMPEEILSDHPDRLRAVFVLGANPLRSYADTTAYEKAFKKLDLLVTTEMAMTETAALSHYVLPARSAYESWDSTSFAKVYPKVFFQMRRPIIEPEGEPKESSEIFLLLAEAMELVPPIPEALYTAAQFGAGPEYQAALSQYMMENQKALPAFPFVVAKTLGPVLGSTNLASLFGLLLGRPPAAQEEAARAGFKAGPDQGMELFQAILDHPEGLWVGECDTEKNLSKLATPDKRIQLFIPSFREWLTELDPRQEEERLKRDQEFPFLLMAGLHMDMNANTNMRNPAWNKDRRPCTLLMSPEDADEQGFSDGQTVRVVTATGAEAIEVEITDRARKGQVIIPHGFGLVYDGSTYGVNINRLTASGHRDRIAATPLHRYVPCRVEAA